MIATCQLFKRSDEAIGVEHPAAPLFQVFFEIEFFLIKKNTLFKPGMAVRIHDQRSGAVEDVEAVGTFNFGKLI